MPDGKRQAYGPGGGKALTVRVTDRKVLFELMRNPRLAVGETYMDGRLIIEDGTILDLLELITTQQPVGGGGNSRKAIKKGKLRFKRLFGRNRAAKSKRNVAHHYDLGTSSTTSSSTMTGNIAAPTSPTRRTAWSRRRPTRRRISPPSCT